MTTTDPARVWDLEDAGTTRTRPTRGTDLRAPIAAGLAAVALATALLPGIGLGPRWCTVVVAGGAAVLLGTAALRRRQTVVALLLAVAGVVGPVLAGLVAAHGAPPPAVVSTVVPDSTLRSLAGVPRSSSAFAALPAGARTEATDFATGLVLRLRMLHGSWGPYPASVGLSQGSVVETEGPLRGAPLGAVPAGTRLDYRVSRDGTLFRVVVTSTARPDAEVSADSSLLPTAGG